MTEKYIITELAYFFRSLKKNSVNDRRKPRWPPGPFAVKLTTCIKIPPINSVRYWFLWQLHTFSYVPRRLNFLLLTVTRHGV